MTMDMVRDLELADLPRRRITEATCRKFGYALGKYDGQDCHVAPFYDKAGVLVAQKLRLPGKKFIWTGDPKKATLFGMQLWKADPRKKLVITEGEIDALSFSQVQGNEWPVVSVKDGAGSALKGIKDNLEWVLGFQEVILAFDSDAPGQEAAIAVAEMLPPGRCRIARLELKDPNEYLTSDRAKDLLKAFWEAPAYRPDGVLDGPAAWDKMVKERAQEKEMGRIPFRQPLLQERWGGRRIGGVYVYGAGTGAGKSTEFREDSVFVMQLGEKVGYIALEETVGQTLACWLSIVAGKRESEMTDEDLAGAFKKIDGRFLLYDHHSMRDIDGLMSKIRYMALAENCRVVYLDHMTAAIVAADSEDDRTATDHFMGAVSALAVELHITIMIISHLSRRDKTNHEGGDAITLKDFRGSHSIPQYATGVIAIERDQQAVHPDNPDIDISHVRALKHRWQGRIGMADTMHYSHKTGRYLPESMAAVATVAPETEESF